MSRTGGSELAKRRRTQPEEAASVGIGRETLVAITAGVLVAAAWEIVLGGVRVGGFELRPSGVGYVALTVLSYPVLSAGARSRLGFWWLLAAAATLTGLPSMAVRSATVAGRADEVVCGFFVAVLLLAPILFAWGAEPARRRRPWPGIPGPVVIALLALSTIAFFQLTQRGLRAAGVPNEERSLVIAGVEVHHVSWGVLLLALVVTHWGRLGTSRTWIWTGVVLLGLGSGLVWDEWLYYMLADPTDDAYFEAVTWVSGVLASVLVPGGWVLLRLHGRREDEGS